MRIDRIFIKNFKFFEEIEFRFNEQFTLTVGDNGTGKTSILEALSVGVSGYLIGFEGVKLRGFRLEEIRRVRHKLGDATVTTELQYPVMVRCCGQLMDREFEWETIKKSSLEDALRNSKTDDWLQSLQKSYGGIIEFTQKIQREIVQEKNHEIILPVVSYQSIARLFSQERNKWNEPFEKEEMSRFVGYADCLDAESNIRPFVNWLRRMTIIQLQKKKQIGEMDAVVFAVEQFMRALLQEEGVVRVEYDFEEEEVMVELGDQRRPLRIMSSGYRTIIGMVADIAYRMSILNPQLRDQAVKETPGIVMIDELDLHLHPKWQWRIVQALKSTFPKVQFTATTHAPIVISSCKDAEIINLHDGEVEGVEEAEKTPYGWLIEDILTDIMDTSSRSPEVEKMIREVQALYSKKVRGALTDDELTELKEKSKKLFAILPEGDPAVTLAKIDAIGKASRGQQDD